MSVVNAGLMLSAPSGYIIERSLRFRSSASAYLSRTPATTTNQKIWTFSCWMKRGVLNVNGMSLISAGVASNNGTSFYFYNNSLGINNIVGGGSQGAAFTPGVLRDPSAWYQIVLSMDTSQTSFANGWAKIWINGTQQTLTQAAAPVQNSNTFMNLSTNAMFIAADIINSNYFDGYITEVNFIDGQALDPTYFGEYNSDTGVWQPIKYTGTYGTNGFYLNFSDNSTTTTLGYDTSGQGNNWSANNISLTSGATYDSMTDVPTLTSEDAANFATINPLSFSVAQSTISNGNLTITTPIAGGGNYATFNFPTTGKWYAEYACTAGTYYFVGVQKPLDTNKYVYYYYDGQKYIDGVATSYGAAYATNDVIGVAVNCDDNEITFYKNGVSQGAISYTVNTGEYAFGFIDGSGSGSVSFVANFGATPFAYTPPTGFKSLNTYNLPDSTIVDGSQYFNTVTYTGNGTSQTVTGFGFNPDMVWHKGRSVAYWHSLVDVLRGNSNVLFSNATNAEQNPGAQLDLATDGATVTYRAANLANNQSSATYVIWGWKANGSGVSNTDGSITSTVSANTTAGFSIVTYTGTGANATVGHGLGVAPKMIVVKNRSNTNSWPVYTSMLGAANGLLLNTTNASFVTGNWNSTSPTSSVFSISYGGEVGALNDNYVAYCFAEVEGYSKFGSYTGNGSTDGPFVYTGFRPRYILIKSSSLTVGWVVLDTARDSYNVAFHRLNPNSSGSEGTNVNAFDALSNGFKLRTDDNAFNQSSATYIYMAFAENPFKNSLAR